MVNLEALHSVCEYGDGRSPAEFLLWMLAVIAVAIWLGMGEDK